MIKSFRDETASDIFYGVNSKAARRVPQRVWKAAQRRMQLLHGTTSTLELTGNGGLHFEPLKYDLPGYFSIWANDQYRICFTFKDGNAYDVFVKDYHPHGAR